MISCRAAELRAVANTSVNLSHQGRLSSCITRPWRRAGLCERRLRARRRGDPHLPRRRAPAGHQPVVRQEHGPVRAARRLPLHGHRQPRAGQGRRVPDQGARFTPLVTPQQHVTYVIRHVTYVQYVQKVDVKYIDLGCPSAVTLLRGWPVSRQGLCLSFCVNLPRSRRSWRAPALKTGGEKEVRRSGLWGGVQFIARPMYSNPPLHGAMLVKEILGDDALKQQCAPVMLACPCLHRLCPACSHA